MKRIITPVHVEGLRHGGHDVNDPSASGKVEFHRSTNRLAMQSRSVAANTSQPARRSKHRAGGGKGSDVAETNRANVPWYPYLNASHTTTIHQFKVPSARRGTVVAQWKIKKIRR